MSDYFVPGGTQYPFGHSGAQQNASNSNAGNSNNSFFSSPQSYPNQALQNQDGFSQSNQPYSFNNQAPNMSSSGFTSHGNGSQGNSGFGNNRPGMNQPYGNNQNFMGGSQNSGGGGGGGFGPSNAFGGPKSNNNFFPHNKPFPHGGPHGPGPFNPFQPPPSTYEKALYTAANQYYKGRGGPRGGRGFMAGNKRGSGGRGSFGGPGKIHPNSGPKPIKATEIKAYLYAWCGQRKLKPEYEVAPKGQQPNVTFTCKLIITGLDHVAEVEAPNKRDAQSKAAWDFCENLVKLGYMKMSELPTKPSEPLPKSQDTGTPGETTSTETSEEIEKHGGWILTNCRQRLNQFCQREHISPDFKHQTLGPEHARLFICDLQIPVKSLQKEFKASERGSTKKQATAVCALAMVRQLFGAGLIERFGDPIKHVSRGSLISGKQTPVATASPSAGQKRKAEEHHDSETSQDTIDENGNWTIENCRQRLNQYCQVNNIPCDVIYSEEGAPGSRTYTASLNLTVKPDDQTQEIKATSTANSKKAAAQGCALQLLSQLYKLTLVEANSAPAATKKKQAKAKPLMDGNVQQPYPNYGFPSYSAPHFYSMPPMFGQTMIRRTPVPDSYLNEKHKTLYPRERDIKVIQQTVCAIETALKDVSDDLQEVSENLLISEDKEEPVEVKRKLQGVMRVGSLAKELLLKGETNVQLVLLCQDAPTAKLLIQIAKILPNHLKAEDDHVFKVETAMPDAAITVQNTVVKSETEPQVVVTVTIYLTSPVVRTPAEDTPKDPPGSLNKDKCLQALAEVRHAKWFQACVTSIPSSVIVIRIFLEMRQRLKEWMPLSTWAIELLVEKALRSSPVPLSLGNSFLRVLELFSSGILFRDAGIADPCERTEVDVIANLTKQDREEITKSAQDSMRLVVFRQISKVLAMDELPKPDFLTKKAKIESPNE